MSEEKRQSRQDGYTPGKGAGNSNRRIFQGGYKPSANPSQTSDPGKTNPPQGGSGVPDKKK